MKDSESSCERRKVIDCSTPRDIYSIRCIFRSVESLSGSHNKWTLDLPDKEKTHKCFRDEGNKVLNFNSHSHIFLSKIVASTYEPYGSYTIRLWGGGCTPNKTLTHLAKDIWDYLISKRIAITVECLHRAINKEVDIPQKRGRTNAIGS